MYIEKTQNKTSSISNFQGFWGCIIQTLKTTKTITNHKKQINKQPKYIFEKILVFSTPEFNCTLQHNLFYSFSAFKQLGLE